ncbi:MAG: hypothetical protein A2469_00140 [Candidatus Magasanikbacteria bacterium RIFOXYC2_FULL_40_16]|uniref:Uncharacterized protein n=1 Tax=Candidatus Magasanikbacteria bacterium RIFOXYC2_FULL_40_16 TaxID=1798703 RepID=A0A1F6P2E9_9BACT|nr:MAG: hypothetical protein A2469_00140 [Candidatus Magasanikbacteria bacterium RIFOXYC2_FULL_40_16]
MVRWDVQGPVRQDIRVVHEVQLRTADVPDLRPVWVAGVGRALLVDGAVAVVVQSVGADFRAAVTVAVGVQTRSAHVHHVRLHRLGGTAPQPVLAEIGGAGGGAVAVVDATDALIGFRVADLTLVTDVAERFAGVGARVTVVLAIAQDVVVAVRELQAFHAGVGGRIAVADGAVVRFQTADTLVGLCVADETHAFA